MDPAAKKKLKRAFYKRNFSSCINIFKKYYDDTTLDSYSSCIVGISYLFKYKLDYANKYLKLAIDLDNSNINAMMGLAVINLKQKNFQNAIEQYLKIIEIDENNKFVPKILDRLKKCDNVDKFVRKMRIKDYIYLPPFIPILSIITLSLVILVVILLVLIIVLNLF